MPSPLSIEEGSLGHPGSSSAVSGVPARRWLPPWDRPHFHRMNCESLVAVGNAFPANLRSKLGERRVAKCNPYGGDCMGDGCIHWFPTPSPQWGQEATCALSRSGQPIGVAEAKRRIGQNIRRGNEALRLGWDGSAQTAFQRAWAWTYQLAEMEEALEAAAADTTDRQPQIPGGNP